MSARHSQSALTTPCDHSRVLQSGPPRRSSTQVLHGGPPDRSSTQGPPDRAARQGPPDRDLQTGPPRRPGITEGREAGDESGALSRVGPSWWL